MKHYRTSFKTLVLVLALLLALLPQRAEAASAALSGNSAIQAGSTVTLKLSISGSNIMGVEATLDYDSSVLEYTNYDQQINGWTMDSSGLKFILYGVSNPINSSTNVLSVTFRVKSGLESGTALSASWGVLFAALRWASSRRRVPVWRRRTATLAEKALDRWPRSDRMRCFSG